MKVRIGIGSGRSAMSAQSSWQHSPTISVELGFDSIWLSETLAGGGLDPLVGLAFVAAHNPTMKLGTTMLLPGRNPVRLAKALATLDVLSAGRLPRHLRPRPHRPTRTRRRIGLEPNRRLRGDRGGSSARAPSALGRARS